MSALPSNAGKLNLKDYEASVRLQNGRTVLLRLIRPEDEPLWLEMFRNFSEESRRYRFFQVIDDAPPKMRTRYCNIDYNKELGIIAELNQDVHRRFLGVVRLSLEEGRKRGELSFIVADPWQGQGLGSKMLDHMIEICKKLKLKSVYAVMLPDNFRAIRLLKKRGFVFRKVNDEVRADLNLAD